MLSEKSEIIAQLKKDMLLLQGCRPPSAATVSVNLGAVNAAFPNAVFPTGTIHEFQSNAIESTAATGGFIAGLLSTLMQQGGVCVWISTARTLFPPALKNFGIEPDQVLFVDLQRKKEVLWTMEEALKCEGISAVIGELNDIDFTTSRRLQLAVEKSRVTGFIIRQHPRDNNAIAAAARWKISPLPSQLSNGMPGIGAPRWAVTLTKVRNGQPGTWQLEWLDGRFNTITTEVVLQPLIAERKIG
ncbi:ImuA family protein [Chitinophaga sp. 22321]|uniref:Error-prone repair protein ImuA n=1 Tax=Chitinophaga hostae TaxID=2831022 RepID=A0ABS5J4A8_9BACT|nr:Error-prone repair protein ImuA [Chitinophaga hostae]MBS0030053.1 Error-prone repair protein ImuA [Chitinophaga hostae]